MLRMVQHHFSQTAFTSFETSQNCVIRLFQIVEQKKMQKSYSASMGSVPLAASHQLSLCWSQNVAHSVNFLHLYPLK